MTDHAGGFSLLKDDGLEMEERSSEGGSSGLTANQMRRLRSSTGPSSAGSQDYVDRCSASEHAWKHLTLLYTLALVAFITAFVAVGKASSAATSSSGQSASKTLAQVTCPYGDVLWGDEVLSYNGHFYQIIGGPAVSMSWMQAYWDARSRCYQGNQGYLANIGSQEENDFIWVKLQTHDNFDSSAGDMNMWLGGADVMQEGTFVWVGPKTLATGTPFWNGGSDGHAIEGRYQNWATSSTGQQLEPNAGGSEDCVELRSGGGHWNDRNCYASNNYFVIEFGDPGL